MVSKWSYGQSLLTFNIYRYMELKKPSWVNTQNNWNYIFSTPDIPSTLNIHAHPLGGYPGYCQRSCLFYICVHCLHFVSLYVLISACHKTFSGLATHSIHCIGKANLSLCIASCYAQLAGRRVMKFISISFYLIHTW